MHTKPRLSTARCLQFVAKAAAESLRGALVVRHKPSRRTAAGFGIASVGSPGNNGTAAFGPPNPSFERIHNGVERSLASVGSAAPLRPAQLQR